MKYCATVEVADVEREKDGPEEAADVATKLALRPRQPAHHSCSGVLRRVDFSLGLPAQAADCERQRKTAGHLRNASRGAAVATRNRLLCPIAAAQLRCLPLLQVRGRTSRSVGLGHLQGR